MIKSGEFGISLADSAHIMTILRDTLYSDKVLAVLREYSCNAWDANKDAGKGDVPIKVTLPTLFEPTLSIRDFGKGLSHDQVFNVYTQYGASTKRSDDETIGMLGIGSKSGFAYSDSFTITSFNAGTKRVYAAVLDDSEKGVINLLHEEPCGDETGVLIQIAVRRPDIDEFTRKAQQLYQYFAPRPEINVEIPPLPTTKALLKSGVIYDADGSTRTGWTAVMGCVQYRINTDQLLNLPNFVRSIPGAVFFKIGEVQINASREELKYSDETKRILVERINSLIDEFVVISLAEIETKSTSQWDKRLRLQFLMRLNVPLSTAFKSMATSNVSVSPAPSKFGIERGKYEVGSISVDKETKIVIKDDGRSLDGYNLRWNDLLVRRLDKKLSWDDLKSEVIKFTEQLEIKGIPVEMLSTRPWVKNSYNTRSSSANTEKYKRRAFKLIRNDGASPLSDNWEAVDRTPESTDVFVLINGFQPVDGTNIFYNRRDDQKMAQAFGKTLPDVYGYKTTEGKPITDTSKLGKSYSKWRSEFYQSFTTEKIRRRIRFMIQERINFSVSWKDQIEEAYTISNKELGAAHPLTRLFRRMRATKKFLKKNKIMSEAFCLIRSKESVTFEEELDEMKEIKKKYPLLGAVLFSVFGDEHAKKWIDYVKLVNNSQKGEKHDESSVVHDDQRIDHPDLGGEVALGAEGNAPVPCSQEGAHGGGLGCDPSQPDRAEELARVG